MTIPISILDLAPIAPGQTVGKSFVNSVRLAQVAESSGYTRVWYAEHHNMSSIASSATSVLIGHVADHTSTIRLGSGGVMLPNHSPLAIAEQFGTLAELHPGRIDLGLGRAPGSDQNTARAMRRDPRSSDQFPKDVLELQAFLRGESTVPGVQAVPGSGTNVPLYILGSSLFGAQLAAAFGLPYAFASHFAPGALHEAMALYRSEFRPSRQLAEPYAIAAVNVIAADDEADARVQFEATRRARVRSLITRSPSPTGEALIEYTDDQIDACLTTPEGRNIANMMRYSAVGTPSQVRTFLDEFAASVNADELLLAHQSPNIDDRLRSVVLTAEVMHCLQPVQ
ncbi:LLM class flavin-dependent oxidoreductase [Frigoribacterium sp. CG_9.8]|uniref:LLM class flavin-dependent oxidoreductase n=1 Tax=Frigoribacterium sp. CG_9.8 TaxID=2787733 RepID=UPI0018CB9344|nr:LLM class flavin-dependent oxidoreductase [Frigoribacterium sp. CG_9.8]MBG6108210.1 luciferase family oxidoreductase group 1 [Frigoribacterium sp. CG_9.8]